MTPGAYQRPSAPRPIGGVTEDALRLFKASFSSCWLPALIMALASSAESFYRFASVPAPPPDASIIEMMQLYEITPPGYELLSWIVILLQFVIYAVLFLNIVAVANGEVPVPGRSVAKAIRRIPALIGASVVFFVAVVVGGIFLLLPGIYLFNRLQVFMVPLITESKGPMDSLGTSWRLIEGQWWHAAMVVSVISVVEGVLVLVLLLVGYAAAATLSAGPLAHSAHPYIIGMTVAGGLGSIVMAPLLVATLVALYQDLVLRRPA